MKKAIALLCLLLAVVFVVSTAFAASIPSFGGDSAYTNKFALISTTSSTVVTGSVVQLGKPFTNVTCLITNPTGSAPTEVVTKIYGGIDSTNLVSLQTDTSAAFPALITTNAAAAKAVSYIKGQIVSSNTGTWPATLRMDCIAAH